MTTRCKTWLGLMLAAYALIFASSVFNTLRATQNASASWINVAFNLAVVFGIAVVLFMKKRVGFYLFCILNAAAYVVNVFFMGNNIFLCMAYAVLPPFITWYFLKTEHNWENLK
ncbi:MAG: hypothetical protein PHC41_03490 [Lachnospiraceae bacterium]|jgi:hypothetical protein|nr:hypothetical protein [Lachnospiraceae bacterium]MDD3615270.1 hypothetical protein [Lachnospiraceae bacterium]